MPTNPSAAPGSNTNPWIGLPLTVCHENDTGSSPGGAAMGCTASVEEVMGDP